MYGHHQILKSSVQLHAGSRVGGDEFPNLLNNMEESIEELRKLWVDITPKGGEICVYCGILATDKEHVTPISWIEKSREMKAMGFDIDIPEEKIVMSCHECNLIASARIFETFTEKRSYIRYKLVLKYSKWISKPAWSDEELDELRGELRRRMVMYNEVLKAIKTRMKYINALKILKNIDYFHGLYHK